MAAIEKYYKKLYFTHTCTNNNRVINNYMYMYIPSNTCI